MYHFGDQDASIPVADIDMIKKAYPDAVIHVYPGAQHGFNCDERASYSASDARLAFGRSVAFLREELE
jgi:carboxymethylenebutenolidase